MAQHTILSTKIMEPGLKEALAEKGIEVVEQEFITIKKIFTQEKRAEIWPWAKAPEVVAIFTSAHAASAVGKLLYSGFSIAIVNHWKAFCLNGATKQHVTKLLPAEQIIDTAPNATELADHIIANGQYKEVVFFCGNQRRNELPDKLKANGIKVHEIIVYETLETPHVATDNVDAVLFFSPSAAKSFFSVNQLKPDTACFAIGNTTAKALSQYTTNRVIASEEPSQEMMAASALFYLQNIDQYK